MNRSILVTGATGFVGTAVAARLAREPGTDVVAAVRAPERWAGPGRAVVYDLVAQALPDLTGIDAVIHCAARVHVMTDTAQDPLEAYRAANAEATARLAAHAAACGVRRFVFISTIKVNGETTQGRGPFTAQDTPAPQDPYAQSKLEAEQALMSLSTQSGMGVVIIRPPLVYGPGVKANFRALMKALDRGWPLPFGALANRRSMIAVDNLADLAVHSTGATKQGVFLARDSEQPTTSELMKALASALGREPKLVPVPASWLRIAGTLIRKQAIVGRLTDPLEVDLQHTCAQLEWRPPVPMAEVLHQTAHAYHKEPK
ncbi:NAD-dependent epimerase/dehydratase family protein [Pseudomonas japonica]|uniref:NAD-dependent epimerase/dehydratase family protein n=1 Tax=Pseudomonas japonica TaxID=256466 RepID=UPI0015E349B7|nr:NAD-dependent epimerase/dehydratase family protein [Pseudomonas japonica]MBA1241963.1 NAD-dependent epimerase/dehydratase family protein [Pseudomonas japonica]